MACIFQAEHGSCGQIGALCVLSPVPKLYILGYVPLLWPGKESIVVPVCIHAERSCTCDPLSVLEQSCIQSCGAARCAAPIPPSMMCRSMCALTVAVSYLIVCLAPHSNQSRAGPTGGSIFFDGCVGAAGMCTALRSCLSMWFWT